MANPKTGQLLSPFDLDGLHLKNRVVLAPLTRSRAGVERMPNQLMAKYYAQRADAGLLITEATVISKQAIGWMNTPGIYSQEQADAWRLVTEAVHAKGAPIFLQLWHCGRASHKSLLEEGQLPVAPSAITPRRRFRSQRYLERYRPRAPGSRIRRANPAPSRPRATARETRDGE